MSRFTKDSKFRLRDFRRRKDYSPDSVYKHPTLGYEYIPIHPFSDESIILEKLELQSDNCKSVDAWWNMITDMCLLGVTTKDIETNRKEGIYASWPREKQGYLYFMVVLDSQAVSRVSFESIIDRINELGLIASEELRKSLTRKLAYVGNVS